MFTNGLNGPIDDERGSFMKDIVEKHENDILWPRADFDHENCQKGPLVHYLVSYYEKKRLNEGIVETKKGSIAPVVIRVMSGY